MKITFDEEICVEKGLPVPELLMLMLAKLGTDIPALYKEMLDKKFLIEDHTFFKTVVKVSQTANDLMESVLLDSEHINPLSSDARLENFAHTLIELYPKGLKPGTRVAWRSNKKDISNRLKKFFKLYGDQYTLDEIYAATKKYVESFSNSEDKREMRVLKYFIWKDGSNTGGDMMSDLATYIESCDDIDIQEESNDDWKYNLR